MPNIQFVHKCNGKFIYADLTEVLVAYIKRSHAVHFLEGDTIRLRNFNVSLFVCVIGLTSGQLVNELLQTAQGHAFRLLFYAVGAKTDL